MKQKHQKKKKRRDTSADIRRNLVALRSLLAASRLLAAIAIRQTFHLFASPCLASPSFAWHYVLALPRDSAKHVSPHLSESRATRGVGGAAGGKSKKKKRKTDGLSYVPVNKKNRTDMQT